MSDEKQRISLFLDRDFVKKMDKEIKSADFKSRNDFVVYAVSLYFADKLLSDENSVVNERLAREIAKARKGNCKGWRGTAEKNFKRTVPICSRA